MREEVKLVLADKISRTALLGSIWPVFGVAAILLISRYTIRIWLHGRLFWDDFFVALAFIFLLCHNVLATVATPNVYMLMNVYDGAPIPPDFMERIASMIKMLFTTNILFVLCLYSVKASLLALLWKLFRSVPMFRRAWWVIAIATAMAVVVSLTLASVACSDLSAFGCFKPENFRREAISMWFTAAADILTDILLMSLPVAFVLKSSLPWPQKLGLVGLFMLGLTVIAMSTLRIVEIDGRSKHPPPSWMLFWSALECSVAVMVSCVASFKSLFSFCKQGSQYSYYYTDSSSVGTTVLDSRVVGTENERKWGDEELSDGNSITWRVEFESDANNA